MNTKLLFLVLFFTLTNCVNNSSNRKSQQKKHVYVQTFYNKDQHNLKLYSLFEPEILNIPFNQYRDENKWLIGYLGQTFSGEADFVELNERSLNQVKTFLSEASDVKVFSDFRYKNHGALLLHGQLGNKYTCESLMYEVKDNGDYILQRQLTPVTLAAHEVYKDCWENGQPPVLESVTEADFEYYYKRKCDGLCVEKQGIIYQNSLPNKELNQLVDSLLAFIKSKMTDLKDTEVLELKKPKIVVFDDVLYVRNQLDRYERDFVLYNIRFKKIDNVWVIDSYNETALILEFIKIAEGEYN